MLRPWFFLQEGRLGLLVVLAYFRVRRAEMVDAAHVHLSCRVLGQVIHNVVAHILDGSVTTERDATDWIDSDVVEKGHGHSTAHVLEDFLAEGRAVRVGVDLRIRIRHRSLFFDVALPFDQLRRQSVDPLAIVVVTLQSIAIGEPSYLLKCYSAAAVPAHSILVLDGHDLLREVALIHIKIEAVHGDKLGKSNVVSLPVVVRKRISEHEDAFLGSMGVKVNVTFKVIVLVGVLANCSFGSPNCRLVPPLRFAVEPV